MVRVAIVEDDYSCQEQMEKYLKKYGQEKTKDFDIKCFNDGMDFLDKYKPVYDIVFMDIEMPYMNGLEVAKRLRERDRQVILVFVTNMAQYAIRGYEVHALNFIVKPITFSALSYLLDSMIEELAKQDETFVMILVKNIHVRLSTKEITYIEVMDHRLIFHTSNETFETFGTLKKMEEIFKDCHFEKCSKSYLVNLRHVKRIEKNMVIVGNEKLQISRQRRADFIMALTEYYSVG